MGRAKRRRTSAVLDTKVYKRQAPSSSSNFLVRRVEKLNEQDYLDFKRETDRRHQRQALLFFFDYVKEELGRPLMMQIKAEACQASLQNLEDDGNVGRGFLNKKALRQRYFAEKRKQFYERYRDFL